MYSNHLEHGDDVGLVEDVGGGVDGDSGEVLDLLRVAVEVDGLLVNQNVELVPPLCPVRPHANLC